MPLMRDFLLCNVSVLMRWSHGYCYFCPENNFPTSDYDYTFKSRSPTLRIVSGLRAMSSSYYSAWRVSHKPPHISPTMDAGRQLCKTPGRRCSQTQFSTTRLGPLSSPLCPASECSGGPFYSHIPVFLPEVSVHNVPFQL